MITLFDKKGLQVTPALFELTDKIFVCENTWMDVVPQRAIIDTAKVSIDWADTQKDYYIINKKDLINSRDDRVRVDGCCGADGTNLNIASKNDLPIGYEHADCYMPHFVRIPK